MPSRSAGNYSMYVVKLKKKDIDSVYIDSVYMKKDGSNKKRVGSTHFVEPDTQGNMAKLYVVKSDSEIVYVGKATRPIRSRLREGLRASYPYMWRHLPKVSILIWCFPDKKDKLEEYAETIEGEVVFLLRECTGKWPKYQMEIHFHNAKPVDAKKAKAIYREAMQACT
jgi:hypothetical protein